MRQTKHGFTGHKLYFVLDHMKQRCYNKNHFAYKYYGGRGIKVDFLWKRFPILFFDWALRNGWKEGLEIDRTNNDGDYEPDNCRFVTRRQNCLNKRAIQNNNTSGFRGSYYHKGDKKWRARIMIKGKDVYLGSFDSPRMAGCRYDVEAIKNNYPTNH